RILAEKREGDDRHGTSKLREPEIRCANELQSNRFCIRGGKCRLQKSVWRDRELELPQFVEGNAVEIRTCKRHGHAVLHIPRIGPADDSRDVLLGHRHSPANWINALATP